MTEGRLLLYAGVLTAAVSAGAATIAAQAPAAPAPPAPPTAPRASAPPPMPPVPPRRMMMLDGRGSQIGVTARDDEATAAGVRIEAVDADGPAQRAGLRAGDVVTEFDGERVRSARQFSRLVQEAAPGRHVSVAVQRDGQRQTLEVTPEDRVATWAPNIDADEIRRDVERSLEGLRDLRRQDMSALRFRMDVPRLRSRARLGVQVDRLTRAAAGVLRGARRRRAGGRSHAGFGGREGRVEGRRRDHRRERHERA